MAKARKPRGPPRLSDSLQEELLAAASVFSQRVAKGLSDVVVDGARRMAEPPQTPRVLEEPRPRPRIVGAEGPEEYFAFLQYLSDEGKVTERWVRFGEDDKEFSVQGLEGDYRGDPKALAIIIVRGVVLISHQKTPPGVNPVIDAEFKKVD